MIFLVQKSFRPIYSMEHAGGNGALCCQRKDCMVPAKYPQLIG